jgi:dihydroorotate dehydrogenase electron transfer subunit
MKQMLLEIRENLPLAKSLMKMKLSKAKKAEQNAVADCGKDSEAGIFSTLLPGQFINIKIDGLYLRRPISINDADKNGLTIIYKIVGEGTKILSEKASGETLDVLLPLGNGFDLNEAGKSPLLIGGGVGTAPLYYLAKKLAEKGCSGTALLGFNCADEIFYREEFETLGFKTLISTEDGSFGIKGFITNTMDDIDYSYAYVCGPEPMLKAVYKKLKASAQFSFEERMGCGFGACMGCSCKTIIGHKRICKEGPVFRKEEILWED